MRRISIAIALTIFLLASFSGAQQTTSNAATKSERSDSSTLPPGPIIGGMGTTNYIPIWASSNFLLSSVIYQASSGNVGVGTTTPAAKLDVAGAVNAYPYMSNAGVGGGVGGVVLDATGFSFFDTFVGVAAGPGGAYTATGDTFVGYGAGGNRNNTGTDNTFVGQSTGSRNTTGSYNLFLSGGVLGAGDNNSTGSSNIYIANEGPTSGTENNAIRIGTQGTGSGQQHTAFVAGIYGVNVGGVPVQINSNGQLGAQTSSLRFKEQIRDMGDSTTGLLKLRPVTFLYKPEYDDGQRMRQYGLIAEEVAEVYPELVAYDNDGKPYSVRYQYLTTMLLNEVQKQYHRAAAEDEVIRAQQHEIELLKQQIQQNSVALQQLVSRLEDLSHRQVQTVAQERE